MTSSKCNSCVICQVKDSYEYIPAFLAHHSNLVDTIILIDHNSQRDLRELSSTNVHVFRAKMGIFAQDITMNAIWVHFAIRNRYSWVFVLDVDEFLPFRDRDQANQFYSTHSDAHYVEFQWRNGVAKDKQTHGIEATTEFLFSNVLSPTTKLCYHTEKAGKFWLRAGNHFAMRPVPKFLDKRFPPKTKKSELELFHVPFLNRDHLQQKLDNFPYSQFSSKIKKNASYLVDVYGKDWEKADVSEKDILWFVANYRTHGKDPLFETHKISFSTKQIFNHLNSDIIRWANLLENCSKIEPSLPNPREKEAMRIVRRHKYRYRKFLEKHVEVTGENEILIV